MNLGQFLVENLLTILCFDKERAKIVRNTVSPDMYSGLYRDIASGVYDFIDKFDEPPGEHVADIFEDKLTSKDKRVKKSYEDILSSLFEAKDGINAEFVMSQLETYVKRQSLRSVAVDLAKALQKDTEASLEEAEELIRKAQTARLSIFDPGTRLSDINKVLTFLDQAEECFPTGIKEFDRLGFGPTRKELYLYIADAKTGKTWHTIQLAKAALMHGWKVLHVSLEMSESKISQRYMQALFAISKRDETFISQRFDADSKTGISLTSREVKPKLTFNDVSIRSKLRKKMVKWEKRLLKNIIVKQFPTKQLTVEQLEAYLDTLATNENFIPDILIVDYPDLMKLPNSHGGSERFALGDVYKRLRGLGVARNCAVVAPTQSNRAGSGVKHVGRTNVSEAYSKIADADVVVTYSQTKAEKELGLARLAVVAGRNDNDDITVIISQIYDIGQYLVDSHVMDKSYWDLIDDETPEEESDDD